VPTIADYRNKFPSLRELDDNALIDRVAEVQGVARDDVIAHMGYKPKARGMLSAINDTVIEFGNAAAGGVKAVGDFVKPGNPVSEFIDQNIIRAGEANQSDVVKAEKARFRGEMDAAEGIGDEIGSTLGYVARNPLLSVAQAAGSFVAPGVAIKGAGMLAGAAGLGAKGTARAGLAGGAVAGAALSGGDAAGTAYELVKKAGGTDEEATEAARKASVLPAAIGAAGGVIGAERLFAGAGGFKGGMLSRALKTAGVEGAQEAVEEGVTQYEGQAAAVPFDPSIDPMKGVAGAATMGAVLGGATGAGVSLLTGEPAQPKKPGVVDVLAAPSVDDAINTAMQAVSVPTAPAVKPRQANADAAAELAMLDPADRAEALSLMQVAERQDVSGNVRRFAQNRLDALLAPYRTIPTGEVTEMLPVADARELTDAERAEYATAAPFSYRRAMERGLPQPDVTELVPAGDATELEAIPVGDASEPIPTAEAYETLPTGEASDLIPTADATEVDAVPAGEASDLDVETIQPGDLMAKDGAPFVSKTGAQARAFASGGGKVVTVPDHFGAGKAGYVVRPLMPARPNNTRGPNASDLPRSSNVNQPDVAGTAGQPAADGAGRPDAALGGQLASGRVASDATGRQPGTAAAVAPGSAGDAPVGTGNTPNTALTTPADAPYFVKQPRTGTRIPVPSPEAAAGALGEFVRSTGAEPVDGSIDVYDAGTGLPAFNIRPDGTVKKVETREEAEARSRRMIADEKRTVDAPTLTEGQRVTLKGESYTVTTVNASAVKLQGADGITKMVATNSKTFGQIQPATGNPMLDSPASWVIREKATGKVVMETFDRKKVDALNTAKYEAVPAAQYLGELNKATKDDAQQTSAPRTEATAPTAAIATEAPAAGTGRPANLEADGVKKQIINDEEGDGLQVVVTDGKSTFAVAIRPDSNDVLSADLEVYGGPPLKGRGLATQAYVDAFEAISKSKRYFNGFVSDSVQSDAARAIYSRLIEAGMPFKRGGIDGYSDSAYTLTQEDLKSIDYDAVRKAIRATPNAAAPASTQAPETSGAPVAAAPMYASRPVTNAADIMAWAASQGFTSTLPADDLHVTVAYSRDAVDGASIPALGDTLTVSGGKRTVEPLGDEGAIVLKFTSPEMQARWKQYREAGASWDYESYTPHVTITYDGKGVDLSKVQPYTGPINLGPEKQEPLNVDKAADYKEAGEVKAAPTAALTPKAQAVKEKLAADLTTRKGMVKALKKLGYEAIDLDAARTRIPNWGRVGVTLNTIPFKLNMVVELKNERWQFSALESEDPQSISQQEEIAKFKADFAKLIEPAKRAAQSFAPMPAAVPEPAAPAAQPTPAATHKDPGEPAEPVTPAVVREAIKTAADNRDRPIKDVKADALRLIDEAMPGAKPADDMDVQMYEATAPGVKMTQPQQAEYKRLSGQARDKYMQRLANELAAQHQRAADNIGYVTIKVPGDGVFEVLNTAARLAEFRKKVEASPGFKAQRPGPIESDRVRGNSGRYNDRAGERFGVESGSGGKLAAFDNMVNEGDLEAASDYADAVGLELDPKKVANATKVLKWREERGAAPAPAPTPAAPAPQPVAEPAAETPAEPELDLKGFTRTPRGNGAFDLSDGNMRVSVEPTERGMYRASFGSSAKSGPRLNEQQAIEWAANIREESKALQAAPATPDAAAERRAPEAEKIELRKRLSVLRALKDCIS
jgi:hypothetical protein